ncbi:MAG: hypothetical protein O7D93_10230 [Acidobacteria bacterium]|nr:hypothetical protein [Acidobacteriota bacterium]
MMTKKEIYQIGALLVVLAMGVADSPVMAAKLQGKTLKAWDEYVRLTEERIKGELNASTGFLAQDFQSFPKAQMERDAALSGRILVEKMKTLNPSGRKIKVPAGTIHHWRGSVFIPNVDLERVLAQVRNPAQQEQLQEDVLESRILEESDDSLRLYLKLVRSKIVTVTYNTEHLIEYQRHGEGLASSRSIATRIVELDQAGTPAEREKPKGKDRGFLWRLNSYWRYQQVDGGVLVECESLTLSRGVPAILAFFIKPIITGVARESMERTLSSMRERFALSEG